MTQKLRIVTSVLAGMLLLSGAPARGADTLTSQGDLDAAIAKSLGQEDASRATITTLLRRDDVRSLAREHGLDLSRAEGAVRTLEGNELQSLSQLASSADAQLAGGDQVISISLVTLLLIVIIVLLLR